MELLHQDFVQSKNDYSLFVRRKSESITIAAVYVGDIIITRDNLPEIQSLKSNFHQIFSVKDLGHLNYFLGLEMSYTAEGIVLTQRKFTNELLHDSGIHSFKKVVTPLSLNLKLQSGSSPLYHNPIHYTSLVGKLNFLTHTRLDLSFTMKTLSQDMQNPTDLHFQAFLYTLNYVASTSG